MSSETKRSIAVMGLPLANVTAQEALDEIERLILSGGTHQVATANLDFWLNSLRDVHLHRTIASCSLVLPDGMPLVWISRLFGSPLKERVSGVDLVGALAGLSSRKGYRIFLLGGRDGVAARAAEKLEEMYPGCQIVGHYAPPLADLERMDHGDTLARVKAAKPDILLVAFGNPKQEKWIRMHSRRSGVPVSIGIGGSLDMIIGDVKRAPRWMQRTGLEWLGRCLQEPTRLFPRYSRNFTALAARLPIAVASSLLQRPHHGASTTHRSTEAGLLHLHLSGSLDAATAPALDRAVAACIDEGQLLVAHLHDLKHVTPEGLGVLLEARQRLMATGLSLALTGVPLRLRLLFSAWCLEPLFDEFKLERERFALGERTQPAARFAALVGKQNLPVKSES
ncbi:MAG TPA: WecB/TagA/CpsF family glycosyltransferase [Acidobacteriaceae bacterium]|nr:WecB/TagA/CpsF family glycosyltransferase [Acidobacteriaceae bacterium]